MNPCTVHEGKGWGNKKICWFVPSFAPFHSLFSYDMILSVSRSALHTVERHMAWEMLSAEYLSLANESTVTIWQRRAAVKVTLRIGGLCYKVSSCSKFTKSSRDYGLAHTQSPWSRQVCGETFINNLPSVSRHNTPDRRLNSADKKIKSLHYPEVI